MHVVIPSLSDASVLFWLASLLLGAVASSVAAPAASAAAPSDGGGAPAQSSESPSGDPSQLSDDQILDSTDAELGLDDSPQPGAPAQAGKQAGEEAAPAKADGKDVAPEEINQAGPVPDDIKALFATPGVGPKVRDMYFRLQAYQEVMPSVAEARKMQELFPEGVKSVEQTMEQLSNFENFDQHFYQAADDPNSAATFVSLMHESDPDHFRAVSNQWAGVWADKDPEGYANFWETMVRNWLDASYEQAERLGDENWINSIDTMTRRQFRQEYEPGAGKNRDRRMDPREEHLNAREKQIRDRERATEQGVHQAFVEDCRNANNATVTGLIKEQLDLLPGIQDIPPGARQRIEADIQAEAEKNLRENAVLTQQLERAVKNGRRDETHKSQIVNLVKIRGRQIIPAIAARVVNDWTTAVLGRAKQQTSQRTEAASRVDMGRGGSPSGNKGSALPNPKDIDYRRTSDDDIMDDNFVLRR